MAVLLNYIAQTLFHTAVDYAFHAAIKHWSKLWKISDYYSKQEKYTSGYIYESSEKFNDYMHFAASNQISFFVTTIK